MENLIELLKKIITNVLTALYQPFWFAAILTVFLLFFYLYAYKPIDTGKGIRAAFRAWWQEFRTSLFFRKLFLLTFFTVMILFQTLINRNMWINPLSDIMGGWWIWHTAADGTVTLMTECFENIALMLPFTALLLRFDFVFSSIPEEYLMGYLWSMPFWIISTIVIFYICRLYHSIWRLASVAELQMILIAYSILAVVYSLGMLFMQMHMPRSYYFIGFLLNFLMTTGLRFSYRLMRFWVNRRNTNADAGGEMHAKDHVMVIGAGAAGQALIKEIINSKKLNTQVVCIIDDNPTKHGRVLEGITIVGDRYSIPEMAKKYKVDRIIYAIPEAAADDRKAILNICKDTGCRLQTVPGVYQLVNGEVSVSRLRNVEITDLLGRAQVQVNMDEIYSSIQGKTLLVTGGGGSIGSELCRQIAGHEPELLVIFDIYENNAYDIEQELKASYPNLNLKVLIGSVRDSKRINWVFETYKPEIVYHAAAHKHVPLMENSPCEAIKNNVVGTYKTAYAAMMNGCQLFVLISTDKAVNPTNIMGASKRLCEMVVQSMNMVSHNGHTDWLPRLGGHRKDTLDALHDNEGQAYVSANDTSKTGTGTEFVAVRFGNVLGSNGSVIPLFKRQIEKGGPVTVTHPDIIRYFMTIPEAVSLVLQAGTYAKGGEIFVLDMGAPVKIDTLARNLIKLSGYTPDVDIKVTYTGLRPGEKLYEEKLMAEEGMEKTPNDLIHIGKPIEMDVQEFFKQLEVLAAYGYANSEKIRDIVAAIVPTYHSADSDLKLHKKVYEELMSEAAVSAEKN